MSTADGRPEGLFVSVSQVKTYLRCPRQYELRYVRGVEPEFVPVPLVFGSAVHTALAAFYTQLKGAGEVLDLPTMTEIFKCDLELRASGPVPLQAGEDDEGTDLGQLVDQGAGMLAVFHESASKTAAGITVEEVEMPFSCEVADPGTGEVLEEKLVGVLDLVVNEDEQRRIYEHKTSSRKYGEDQLRFDIQPTAYRLAAQLIGMGECGVRFQVLTKTKKPAVQLADVVRTQDDERDFLRTVVGVLRAVDAGASWPVRGWACRGCPYHRACSEA